MSEQNIIEINTGAPALTQQQVVEMLNNARALKLNMQKAVRTAELDAEHAALSGRLTTLLQCHDEELLSAWLTLRLHVLPRLAGLASLVNFGGAVLAEQRKGPQQ